MRYTRGSRRVTVEEGRVDGIRCQRAGVLPVKLHQGSNQGTCIGLTGREVVGLEFVPAR